MTSDLFIFLAGLALLGLILAVALVPRWLRDRRTRKRQDASARPSPCSGAQRATLFQEIRSMFESNTTFIVFLIFLAAVGVVLAMTPKRRAKQKKTAPRDASGTRAEPSRRRDAARPGAHYADTASVDPLFPLHPQHPLGPLGTAGEKDGRETDSERSRPDPAPSTSQEVPMTKPRSLAAVLFEVLPIPFFARRNLYVERALQERRAAATALECIEANLLCLQADLDDMVGASEESRRTLSRMRQHISDLQALTRYDEVEMEHAGDEI